MMRGTQYCGGERRGFDLGPVLNYTIPKRLVA
jgi:hypothetical protein